MSLLQGVAGKLMAVAGAGAVEAPVLLYARGCVPVALGPGALVGSAGRGHFHDEVGGLSLFRDDVAVF